MRINACVVAITAGLTVDQVVHLDLAYAPPFASGVGPDAGGRPRRLKLI
jgi:hypothetical protein